MPYYLYLQWWHVAILRPSTPKTSDQKNGKGGEKMFCHRRRNELKFFINELRLYVLKQQINFFNYEIKNIRKYFGVEVVFNKEGD